ncbi:MAG: fatty-acid synthase [Okeania sp. SIO3I5]|uniref:element excision factor XisH family protein n=1 Tax=Okeania sp. SIO3I5 TaxID=2607805 RepID=UPI0013B7D5E9|nr:element excision factor XisH family protein [Okeania sp. SIO3I5]NEQ40503.1 fatty-acid synthase [Okeania sp. SIO3I5]
MLTKDRYHDNCKNALIKDSWTITHDPLRLRWGSKDMYVDLGAEKLLIAEKNQNKIAVEIKTFAAMSEVNALENALGQYLLYRSVISRTEPDRKLYLAIPSIVYADIFEDGLGKIITEDYQLLLLIFDINLEEIIEWIE